MSRKFKAHVNRWVPGGGMSITSVEIHWTGEKPLTAAEVLTAALGSNKWQEALTHQPGGMSTKNTDEWMFVLAWPTGNPEFVNIWIEDILPAYHQDLELRRLSQQVTRLGESIKESELELASRKFQYDQSVARYNQLVAAKENPQS